MDITEMLKVAGLYGGLGGISIALIAFVFREFLTKVSLPIMTKEHAYRLVRLVIVLSFALGVIGLGAWVYTFNPVTSTPPDVARAPASLPPPTIVQSDQPNSKHVVHEAPPTPSKVVKSCSFSGGTNNGTVTQDCSH